MNPDDTLLALAEVAAAFAGFSGIVAALGHRTPSEWSPAARFRFQNLLTVTVAASLLAFLPVALGHLALSPAAVWTGSGLALALFCTVCLADAFRRGAKVGTGGPGLRRWMAVVWVSGMAGAAIAPLIGLVVPGAGGGGPYIAGILLLLAISGLQFVLLALRSVTEDP